MKQIMGSVHLATLELERKNGRIQIKFIIYWILEQFNNYLHQNYIYTIQI
jgi:hypothetical protein